MTEGGRAAARRERSVAQVRDALRRLYRAFVAWYSLYDDDEDERRAREAEVARLLAELSRIYPPRSVWLEAGTREAVEGFVSTARELRRNLHAEIEARGYAAARAEMERRVGRELGPLKREAFEALEAER
ncbi:MAG: hypothetical protein AB1425_17510, partial [Actinomycetota bacterium]